MQQGIASPVPEGISVRARPFSAVSDGPTRIHNVLTRQEQKALSDISTVLELSRGRTPIFSEGSKAEFLYALGSGVVRIYRHTRRGERQILAFLFPGDLFGLAEDGRYVNSAETVTETTVYRLPLRQLRRLLLREPLLQLHLLIKAAHDLRTAQRQIIIVGQQQSDRRLACLLADLCQSHGLFDDAERTLRLPMLRPDIADYLAVSAESVSRAFGRLERKNLVRRLSATLIEIPSLSRLARFAQGNDAGG